MERQTRSSEKDKKTRKARKRTLTGGSNSDNNTTTGGSRTSSATSSRERSASISSRLSIKSGASSVKSGSVHKSFVAVSAGSGEYIITYYIYVCLCVYLLLIYSFTRRLTYLQRNSRYFSMSTIAIISTKISTSCCCYCEVY